MSAITFGKYAGKTPEQLKRIDPGYLAWGAQNLHNAKWAVYEYWGGHDWTEYLSCYCADPAAAGLETKGESQ